MRNALFWQSAMKTENYSNFTLIEQNYQIYEESEKRYGIESKFCGRFENQTIVTRPNSDLPR